MTQDMMIDAIGMIDADLLEEYALMEQRLQQKNKRRMPVRGKLLLAAACLMLTFTLLLSTLPLVYIVNREAIDATVAQTIDRVIFPLDSEDSDVSQEDLLLNWTEWPITKDFFVALGAGTQDSVIDWMVGEHNGLVGELLQDIGAFLARLYEYYLDHKQEIDSTIGELESGLNSGTVTGPSPDGTEIPTEPPVEEIIFYHESLILQDYGEGYLTVTDVDTGVFTGGRIKVPSEYEDYKIRAIGDYAFANLDTLGSVILPDTIDSIGDHAFENCTALTNFTYEKGMDMIGEYAFAGCVSLEEFTLHAGIDSVGVGCFSGCTSLVTVNYNCKGFVPDHAFDGCTSLQRVIFYESIQSIGAYAFNNCESFLNLAGKYSLSYVGPYAFHNSGLLTTLFYGETISAHAYENCKYIATLQIENSVKKIEDYAFYGCTNLLPVTAVFNTAADWESVELGRHVFPDGTRIVFIDGSEIIYYDTGE